MPGYPKYIYLFRVRNGYNPAQTRAKPPIRGLAGTSL